VIPPGAREIPDPEAEVNRLAEQRKHAEEAADEAFLARLKRVWPEFEKHLIRRQRAYPPPGFR
jgi:hypothetical protein